MLIHLHSYVTFVCESNSCYQSLVKQLRKHTFITLALSECISQGYFSSAHIFSATATNAPHLCGCVAVIFVPASPTNSLGLNTLWRLSAPVTVSVLYITASCLTTLHSSAMITMRSLTTLTATQQMITSL